jgi:hypothetical protein
MSAQSEHYVTMLHNHVASLKHVREKVIVSKGSVEKVGRITRFISEFEELADWIEKLDERCEQQTARVVKLTQQLEKGNE